MTDSLFAFTPWGKEWLSGLFRLLQPPTSNKGSGKQSDKEQIGNGFHCHGNTAVLICGKTKRKKLIQAMGKERMTEFLKRRFDCIDLWLK